MISAFPPVNRFPIVLLAIAIASVPGTAAAAASTLQDLASLSLEELGQIVVTSVARQPRPLSESPSAIQVITSDDIRRSGATSIPEALRLATNLQVAQSSSQEWVITARGFSSDVGNKLLVMVDGRTVYTPLFSGVFWDRQDYLLADIERIEVISGPGGTLWGTNAVNGVINIITRTAADSAGVHMEAAAGSELRHSLALRQGGTLAPDVHYRVYAKHTDRDGVVFPSGQPVPDAWDNAQAGFRIDAETTADDNFTLQGDTYRIDSGIASGGRALTEGFNVLGRWSHQFSASSDMILQVYYDSTELTLPVPAMIVNGTQFAGAGRFKDSLDTLDVDFQHGFELGARNRLVWGLAHRHTDDDVQNAPALGFLPAQLRQQLYSAFVQDEFALLPERLLLTLGSKFEHNDYTGWEVVPSGRLQWNLQSGHTLWAAVSRAVRMPSRIDRDISYPSPNQPPQSLVILKGGSDFDSETVVAWEAGYRAQVDDRLSAALAMFYNEYDNIRSTNVTPVTILPFFFANDLEGETHGIEFSFNYQLRDWWRLGGGYNLLREDIRVKPGRYDFNRALNETADPEHQVALRSSMDLPGAVGLDFSLRWVDELIINDSGRPDEVPAYAELNLRLSWAVSDNLELSVAGQNLLDSQHPEFNNSGPRREEIERSFYGKVVYQF